MNRFLNFNFLGFILVLLVSPVFVTETNAQNILGDVLRRMDLNNRSLQSVQSAVKMEKHNPQLNVTDTYTGTTSYLPKTTKRGMYMRLDWSKPVVEHISVIGDDYELYKPSINQVYVGKIEKARNSAGAGSALGFINMSKEQLKANYTITMLGEELVNGTIKTAHLLLTPRSLTSYKTAEIWVDSNGMPNQVRITERNNDTTTVLLDNIRKNVTIKTEIFRLSYDRKKVKIVRA